MPIVKIYTKLSGCLTQHTATNFNVNSFLSILLNRFMCQHFYPFFLLLFFFLVFVFHFQSRNSYTTCTLVSHNKYKMRMCTMFAVFFACKNNLIGITLSQYSVFTSIIVLFFKANQSNSKIPPLFQAHKME